MKISDWQIFHCDDFVLSRRKRYILPVIDWKDSERKEWEKIIVEKIATGNKLIAAAIIDSEGEEIWIEIIQSIEQADKFRREAMDANDYATPSMVIVAVESRIKKTDVYSWLREAGNKGKFVTKTPLFGWAQDHT